MMSLFFIIFFSLGIFSLISIITLVKTFIKLKTFDELQKKAIYESLSISFLIIIAIHFIQLVVAIIAPEPFSLLAKFIISPGDYNGALFTNSPLHFDSFMIDSLILGVVYYIKRKKYGLI
ncbi:hypothetical protein [Vagococcus fluvialis]|uniref:hypothetical protein n=1 Tax=Vagococcus fluvialis TaxID=2738 RepID=UPI003B5A85BD